MRSKILENYRLNLYDYTCTAYFKQGNCLYKQPDNYQQKIPVLLLKGQNEGCQNLHMDSQTTCVTKL